MRRGNLKSCLIPDKAVLNSFFPEYPLYNGQIRKRKRIGTQSVRFLYAKNKDGKPSLQSIVFSVLQSSNTVFLLELSHEVIFVIVAALLGDFLNTKLSMSKQLHCLLNA